jgi:predicted metal-binding protein
MAIEPKCYQVPWEGQLVLACKKCQKKLKHDEGLARLSKLKKAVKGYNETHVDKQLHVISVPCMDLCPKGGVSVFTTANQCLSIVRNQEDIGGLWVERN